MVNYIAKRVNGTSTFLNPEGQEIDLGEKWKEVDFMEGL
jgi:lysyl-tRNA synthetase class II